MLRRNQTYGKFTKNAIFQKNLTKTYEKRTILADLGKDQKRKQKFVRKTHEIVT